MRKIAQLRSIAISCAAAGVFASSAALAATTPTEANLPAATPTDLEFSSGFDYTIGRYGLASDTTVWDVPFGAKLQAGNLRVEGYIPYIDIKGPGVAAGDVVVTSGKNIISEHSGVGDLTLIGGWTVLHETGPIPGIELAGTVKFPTAGTNLGTGKTDFTAQANLFHSLTPTVLLFGSVGYQWLGSPTGFPLTSGFHATAGVNFQPQSNIAWGATLDYREKYEATLPDYVALDPYALWRFADNFGISIYAIAGLSNSAPRFGAGLRLIFYAT